jgi:hypothetical protein
MRGVRWCLPRADGVEFVRGHMIAEVEYYQVQCQDDSISGDYGRFAFS